MTRFLSPFLALAVMSFALETPPAGAQSQERCYGIARAGQADGIGDREAPGSGSRDYQGDAWKWVPQGSCLTTALPPQQNGTPRRGSLVPLQRDLS